MQDHIYKVVELVRTSESSIEDAIRLLLLLAGRGRPCAICAGSRWCRRAGISKTARSVIIR